ncbi:hypothetical protein EG347_11540 [Chryseobacterium sp. G0186]|uniref:beta strand repeat-containing protein n=1 Tax=Chryseobacterium sp. G0186 TaxID=2487064 RepID=UPI000F4DC25B|nr:hypothetical protein [Chryseobacterium sp. G0186]AZA78100.1 hypothetical protein EG347_11540 [Chryseobacterium sp. G0186]
MKKYHLLIVLFAANAVAQQSPGGVSLNLQVWMKADAGLSKTGNNITAWKDQSPNAFSPTVVGGPPQAGSFVNFNPVVKITGSGINGGYFRIPTTATNFANLNVTVGSAQTEVFSSVFATRTNNYSSIVAKNNGGIWDGITLANVTPSGTVYQTGYAVSDWFDNGANTSAQQNIDHSTAKIFLLHGGNTQSGSTNTNRFSVNGNTNTINNTAFFNPNPYDFTIGNNSASGTQYGFEGLIGDVIYYNKNLNTTETQKVNSYLAIKYGVTLASNQSYISSAGTDFWTGGVVPTSTYNNNIFGIARDDSGSTDQRQSQSQNTGIQPILTNGSAGLVTTNSAAPTLSDLSSSIIGSDTGSTGYATPITGPSGVVVNNRTDRIWLVREQTGTVGNVTISFPASAKKVYVVRSANQDTTFDATDTWIELTNPTVINGVTYVSATIDFANNDLFTFATFKPSPGGVASGISLWNRADVGVSPTSGTINTWTDQASGHIATQLGTDGTPSSIAGSKTNLNFNPGINFTTVLQRIGNISVQTVNSLDYDIFNVTKHGMSGNDFFGIARNNTTMDGTNYDSPHFEVSGLIYMRNSVGTLYSINIGAYDNTIPTISYTQVKDLSIAAAKNGNNTFTSTNYPAKGAITGGYIFGRNADAGTGGDDSGITGVIGENIVYSRTLTPIERQKVDSYLAIKYGLTLSTSATPLNYLNSASTTTTDNVVWTGVGNTTYYNRVFGIGRDDSGGLDQRISISADPAAIVTLSTDNDFTSQNAPTTSHPAIGADKQFTMVGDNNLPLPPQPYNQTVTIGGKTLNRLSRVWRAQDTGDMGCVNVRIATNVAGNSIPAPTGGGSLYAILADDPGFTTNVSVRKVTYSATNIDLAINFNANSNNNYFTLAVLPAGSISAPVTGKIVGISTVDDTWKPTSNNTYLDLHSQKTGFVISRVTTANRLAMIQQPGLMVYDIELAKFYVSNGSAWRELGVSANVKSNFCN